MRVHLSLVATRNTPSMIKSTSIAAENIVAVTESVTEKDCFNIMRIASSFSVFASVGNSTTTYLRTVPP